VEGEPDTYLFGKLYAMSHVRADRWYKLGRTILYGRLEDEKPFQSVRRLVQYEDYALRMVRDAGIHTACPYGIVEMTPEREYLLVAEFFDGAVEMGEATVDDDIIDQGLLLVRRLWDAGLAHRDIKPANLLVRDGELLLIDVAFVQVRPSPWRQAIDLANMMLVMAVRTDAPRVYERAVRLFTPDEIAEAFAATRGVASPTQLRVMMKRDGRDLVEQFRRLAPPRRPISLQRWSVKRILLAAGVLVGGLVAVLATFNLFVPAELEGNGTPDCGTSNVMVLMAQSVPSATAIPCLAVLPAGWDLGGIEMKRGESRFWLDSDIAGRRAVTVTLVPPSGCRTDAAVEVLSDEADMQRFEEPERLPPELRTTRSYRFAGGCVTYEFDFGAEADTELLFAADSALAFQPRRALVEAVADRTDGLKLCGAEAPPCTGGP
jgi:tRNA A-37 threonylcarbamoyl transferase component Bud32